MNNYVITVDENGSPSLQHYGVIGMKWGVRHDPQRAYDKSKKKLSRIQKKIDRNTRKANKQSMKAITKSGGLFASERKYEKALRKAAKSSRKALAQTNKASKWIQRMEKEFAKQNVVTMDPAIVNQGKEYLNRVTAASDQMYLRNL